MRQLKITQSYTIRTSSIEAYLTEVNHYPMVTPDEEAELAMRMQAGDESAFEKLVLANLRFVITVAKQYQGSGMELGDLISLGNLGLMTAVRRFDASRGMKLISYAVWWIRQSILSAISDQSRTVRLPNNQVVIVNRIARANASFYQENGRNPSEDELAEITGYEKDKILRALELSYQATSLDKPMGDGDDTGTLMDVLPNDSVPSSDDEADRESLRTDIDEVMVVLNERERQVLKAFYGIGGSEQSLDEIADNMDLTRERVRQIKEVAVRKLAKPAVKDRLRQYLG